jgi:hypothetical protein
MRIPVHIIDEKTTVKLKTKHMNGFSEILETVPIFRRLKRFFHHTLTSDKMNHQKEASRI